MKMVRNWGKAKEKRENEEETKEGWKWEEVLKENKNWMERYWGVEEYKIRKERKEKRGENCRDGKQEIIFVCLFCFVYASMWFPDVFLLLLSCFVCLTVLSSISRNFSSSFLLSSSFHYSYYPSPHPPLIVIIIIIDVIIVGVIVIVIIFNVWCYFHYC